MPRFFFNGDPSFGARRIGTQLKNAKKKSAEKARKLLLQPTNNWDHGVHFQIDDQGDVTTVTTEDDVYGYLDDGTKPHEITGYNPALLFQENFTPKTTPGSLNSVYGGKSGNYVYPAPNVVQHPGNEARDFTGQVMKAIEPGFQSDIDNEIAKSLA